MAQVDEVLPIARQIAEALEAAHQAGIVHRDLKPANIKVRPDGPDVRANPESPPTGSRPWSRPPTTPTISGARHRRGALTRQTFEPGEDETSTWIPDGKILAYASSRSDKPRTVFRRRADGAGAEEAVWTGPQHVHVETVTPDGRALILAVSDVAGGQAELMLLPLDGDRTLKPLLQSIFAEAGARLSPDGRWLAYFSMETGRDEVYVRAYPALEGKTQVSTGGGRQPVWSKKGDELFFRGEGAMMAVRVGPGAPLSVTAPRKLFDDRYYNKGNGHTGYDVSRDGRFLTVKDPNAGQASSTASALPQTNFSVVLNWFEELKQTSSALGQT